MAECASAEALLGEAFDGHGSMSAVSRRLGQLDRMDYDSVRCALRYMLHKDWLA
jgi:hypothetical protein